MSSPLLFPLFKKNQRFFNLLGVRKKIKIFFTHKRDKLIPWKQLNINFSKHIGYGQIPSALKVLVDNYMAIWILSCKNIHSVQKIIKLSSLRQFSCSPILLERHQFQQNFRLH